MENVTEVKIEKKDKKVKKSKSVIKRQPSDELVAMVLDKKEDELIRLELGGQMVDKLGYEVVDKSGNLLMRDLTYIGFRELARAIMHVKFSEPKETYMPEEKLWAVRIEATNLDTGENAWGGAEVSAQYQSGTRNAFPYRQALIKAQRNALKQLIPLPKKLTMMEMWIKLHGSRMVKVAVDAKTIRQELPSVDKANTLLAGIFAGINELGLPKDKMHQYLRNTYKTDHLRSLKTEELQGIKEGIMMYKKNAVKLAELKVKLDSVEVKKDDNA